MDELDWYEKDFDDQQEEIRSPQRKSYSKRIWTRITDEENYPFDVWYLIGIYIAPEDIGRFALICRMTNRVVHTPAFWISIFNRYSKFIFFLSNRILLFIL
jgi:hypothetical protein